MGSKLENTVSIRKDGSIFLANDVYKKMGEPKKVTVMINEVNNMILLSPSNKNEDETYPVNKNRVVYIKDIYRIIGYKVYPIGRKKVDFCGKDIIIYLKEDIYE